MALVRGVEYRPSEKPKNKLTDCDFCIESVTFQILLKDLKRWPDGVLLTREDARMSAERKEK